MVGSPTRTTHEPSEIVGGERKQSKRAYDFSRFALLLKSSFSRSAQPQPQGYDFRSFLAHFFPKRSGNKFLRQLRPELTRLLFTVSLIVSFTRCTLPQPSDLLVTSLRCTPSAFDSFRANTEVRYTLASAATITLYIAQRSQSGDLILVNTLASNIRETKGSHAHTWLGDTHLGVFAESGDYIAVLQINNTTYEAAVRVFHW